LLLLSSLLTGMLLNIVLIWLSRIGNEGPGWLFIGSNWQILCQGESAQSTGKETTAKQPQGVHTVHQTKIWENSCCWSDYCARQSLSQMHVLWVWAVRQIMWRHFCCPWWHSKSPRHCDLMAQAILCCISQRKQRNG
jgi:hypothetical protein